MRNSRAILISISLAIASMEVIRTTIPRSKGVISIKPNKKSTTIPKKVVKSKSKNYTSKMKIKPNTVRKDFNQRRR